MHYPYQRTLPIVLLYICLAGSFVQGFSQPADYAVRYLKGVDSLKAGVDSLLAGNHKSAAAAQYVTLSELAQRYGQYKEMLAYLDQALTLYIESNDIRGQAFANFMMGFAHRNHLSDNASALVHHRRFLELSIVAGDTLNIARAYQNVANILRDQGKLGEAAELYQKAISAIESIYYRGPDRKITTDPAIQSRFSDVHHDFGELNVIQKEYKNALALFNTAKAASNNPSGQAMFRLEEAKVHALLKDYSKAIALAKEALEISEGLPTYHRKAESHILLHEFYKAVHDYDNSIFHFKEYTETQQAIKLVESGNELIKLRSELELQRRAKELELLAQEKESVEFRRNAYGISVILLLVIAILVYSQQRAKHKRDTAMLEKEKEVDRMKSKFFTSISHELRTPLTLILGPLAEVKTKTQDQSITDDLRVIDKNANRLLTLVNRLLDLQKIEAGQMALRVSQVDLNQFLGVIASSFESLAKQRKIEFRLTVPDEPIMLYADRSMLEEIIVNLISNAFKFTPQNGKIEIHVERCDSVVNLSVTDSGKGIARENLNSIFKPFYQENERKSEYQAGTGLGLAMVKELTELHSGKISVESTPGSGSTFRISLPLGNAHFKQRDFVIDDAVAAQPKVRIEDNGTLYKTESNGKGISVLIVDDNEDLRNFIGSILPDGYARHFAENGEDALQLASEIVPDLIVSDVMMPGMDGIELCEKIKTDEVTSHIPVLLLTAKADRETKLKGLETEADDYLTKPFDREELNLRIRNLIESRRKLRIRYNSNVDLRPSEISVNSADQRFLQKIKDVIEANMSNELFDMEILEREIGMSRSQMHRKLKALTDQSATQIIRSMRLVRAKDLLEQKAGGVAEIAYQVGFSTSSSFIRAYKEHFGSPPGEVLRNS